MYLIAWVGATGAPTATLLEAQAQTQLPLTNAVSTPELEFKSGPGGVWENEVGQGFRAAAQSISLSAGGIYGAPTHERASGQHRRGYEHTYHPRCRKVRPIGGTARDPIRRILVVDGHQVETAASGEAALALWGKNRFDLVIVDYELPLMNGDKVAVAIKALDPNQPIALITAYAEALQSAATPLPSVDLVISKPFDVQEFRQAVTRLLRNSVRSPGATRGQCEGRS